MINIDEWILTLIDSQLESIDVSEVCPCCEANDSHLVWSDEGFVVFECAECGSDWPAGHWSVDDTGAPVQTEPRVLLMLDEW